MKDLIIESGYFFLFLNTLVFTIMLSKKKSIELGYFICYLILCLLIQLYSHHLSSLGEYNLFLSHYLFIGQFIFLSFFFSKILKGKKTKKSIQVLIPIISIPLLIYYVKFPEKLSKWNEVEIIITSIPLLVYSLLFLASKIDSKEKKYIYFTAGFFTYTLTSTLLFISGNIDISSREIKIYLWKVNSVLYLVFQILIFVEWYKNFRKKLKLLN
jgi:hypothetical protein